MRFHTAIVIVGTFMLALLIVLALKFNDPAPGCPAGEVPVWSPGEWVCVRKGG